jgi:two-component system chemotaxis sensor kinase CheA
MASDAELLELLFLPGFSTAEAVTSVSGRGVGMDVVRSALERAGGSVNMTSRAGQGATMTMTMPLTLAIVSALIVRSGNHQYAIPQASLEEVVRVEGTEDFHELPVLRLRGSLIPLVDLARLFGIRADDGAALAGFAAIVRTDGRTLGLVVDEVHDMQEIVVKPLPKWFRASRCFSGLAILGDGSVAVILDAAGLRRRARVGAVAVDRDLATKQRLPVARGALQDRVVLVSDGRGGRQALRLQDVVRIEQAPRSTIESLDGSPVIQYGGNVLHLIDLCPWAPRRDPVNVLVTTIDGRLTGLIVDEVLDIGAAARRQGSTADGREIVVINGQVASLQDLRQIIATDRPGTGLPGAGAAA